MEAVYTLPFPLRSVIRAVQIYRAAGARKLVASAIRSVVWIFLSKARSEIKCRIHHFNFHLNALDAGISRELYIYGVHEPLTTHILMDIVKPGMTVVDVGANLGYYTLLEARLVGPQGKVIAIEPYPRSVRFLRRNIVENEFSYIVSVVEAAVGDCEAYVDFAVSEKANWNRILDMSTSETDISTIKVKMIRLDDVVGNCPIDFIRMDIEGAEVKAIRGAFETITSSVPILCIELHPQIINPRELKHMLEILDGIGYRIVMGYPRKADLIGIGQRSHIRENIDFRWFVGPDGPLFKKEPYTVWLQTSK